MLPRGFNVMSVNENFIHLTRYVLPYPRWKGAKLWGHEIDGDSHYSDVIISPMTSQITSLTIVYSTVYLESPVIGEFPAQRARNTENVSIWLRHHDLLTYIKCKPSRL